MQETGGTKQTVRISQDGPNTRYASDVEWQGQTVEIEGLTPCPTNHARLAEMLHYGEPGTGFIECQDCGAVGWAG